VVRQFTLRAVPPEKVVRLWPCLPNRFRRHWLPQTPYLYLRGPTSKGRGGREKGNGRGEEGKGLEGPPHFELA